MHRRALVKLAPVATIAPCLIVLSALATSAHAGDAAPDTRSRNDPASFFDRMKKESAIERRMIWTQVKGMLGLYQHPLAPDWSPRAAGKGRLEIVRGVPVLHLEGTPEEMGEQAGKLVGREARALATSYLPAFVGGPAELDKARERARKMFAPHLLDSENLELSAFAKASFLSEDDMLLAQSFTDLYRLWSCTTIGAVGEASDEPLLGRNLDFVDMGFLNRYSYVVVAKPTEGEPYVSVSWPGLIGVLSGMNRSGVSLAVMVVHDEHTCTPGVPFQLAFRRALSTSKTTAEVEANLRATTLTVTNNLMVVDAQGSARLLELSPSGIATRGPEHGRLYATNHFLTEERREPRLSLTYLSSRRRLAAAEKKCNAADKITVPVAIDGLRASAAGFTNVQSMVFLPRSGELYVGLQKPPAASHELVKLSKSELLGD